MRREEREISCVFWCVFHGIYSLSVVFDMYVILIQASKEACTRRFLFGSFVCCRCCTHIDFKQIFYRKSFIHFIVFCVTIQKADRGALNKTQWKREIEWWKERERTAHTHKEGERAKNTSTWKLLLIRFHWIFGSVQRKRQFKVLYQ